MLYMIYTHKHTQMYTYYYYYYYYTHTHTHTHTPMYTHDDSYEPTGRTLFTSPFPLFTASRHRLFAVSYSSHLVRKWSYCPKRTD